MSDNQDIQHNIRNPLAIIMGAVCTKEMDPKAAESILNAVKRITEYLDGLNEQERILKEYQELLDKGAA